MLAWFAGGLVQIRCRTVTAKAAAADAEKPLLPWQKLAGEIKTRCGSISDSFAGALKMVERLRRCNKRPCAGLTLRQS
jgi:hypothetical protein